MKPTLLMRTALSLVLAAALTLFGGCATSPIASQSTEESLLAAGFRAEVATTAKQRQQLQTLPTGQVSGVSMKGSTRYIYPDRANDRLYVGDAAAYQRLQASAATERDSSGPVHYTGITRGGIKIPVDVIHDWTPFEDL